MKKTSMILLFFALAFALNACGSEPTPTNEPSAVDIYTSVAQTVMAEIEAAKSTPTPAPAPQEPVAPEPSIPPEAANPEPTTAPQAAPTATVLCDNSAFISDVTIPDGAALTPGEAFTKTWKMQNSGACAWNSTYVLDRLSGSAMSGSATPLKSTVDIWKKVDISVELVAPKKAGTYTGYWKLKNAAGQWFGTSVYVKIVVAGDAVTVTPTPTSTAEGGETTPTDTKTPKPTKTETPEGG